MAKGPYKPKKLFTLDAANSTLPLVSRIIADVVRVHTEMLKLNAEANKLAEEGRSVRAEEIRDRILDLAENVESFVAELDGIGCVCKDHRAGLVDYPARMGNRIVFLCWRLGEKQIKFWHELESGFSGRKSVKGAFA